MENNQTFLIDLKQVSKEEFQDAVEYCDCDLGEPRNEDDIVVTHYTERGEYVGSMCVTEFGTEYLVRDLPQEGITLEEAHELLYGA